ncbi:YlxQ family RNA-binding protein [Aneurinibacillus danicus]|jgi:ribosomal protein L7Ae-like RNA K-turn-binding protein|uniref:50S ribosomal protein L7ae n=1 Tax=Aneurinibacillus danicus TaxID=267746 RepID=A0A511V7G3_9BACL|nr:YlxQ family RNA-binding protein [Aneurinibacillus danicus]GEN33633.1 50S ribosomal protein L7ae [Aneurinibacillus danicus]
MNQVEQMLGLAQRARKLITGEELVIKAVRQGQVHLVILAGDASPNTRKKVIDKCGSYEVSCTTYGDRLTLGAALGKEQRVVIGVTDAGFAARLTQLINQ